MTKIINIVVAREAKKKYKTCVALFEKEMKTFLTNPEIQLKHIEAEKKALDYLMNPALQF